LDFAESMIKENDVEKTTTDISRGHTLPYTAPEVINDTINAMPENDIFDQTWSDPRSLEQEPLTMDRIIPYFSASQFYSTDCTNSVLAMNRVSPENLNNEMRQHKGRQYWVEDSWPKAMHGDPFIPIPRLLIISRQQRKNTENSSVTGLYWVADGRVSQSPSLLHALQTRLQSTVYHIDQAFKKLEDLTELNITYGYKWKDEVTDLRKEEAKETLSNDLVKSEGRSDKDHMNHFLLDFQKKFDPRKSVSTQRPNELKRANQTELDRGLDAKRIRK